MTDLPAHIGGVRTAGRALRANVAQPWRHATVSWRRNRDLLDNATSLTATTGVTSVLGFVYWAIAAREFSQRAVGYGSASVSAMTLLGTVGMLGLGTVLIGELPRRAPRRAGLVAAALFASAFASLLFGLAFVLISPHFSSRFADMSRTPLQTLLFVAGVTLTGVTLVFDQATIGLLRGGLQLGRNLSVSLLKLMLLPAAVLLLHDEFGTGILLCWVAGMALSVAPIAYSLRRASEPLLPPPEWGALRRLGRTTLAHNWLNLSVTLPRSFIPVLVTVVVSPTANAAFYAAWMLSGFLYMIPNSLATVLFAVAAANPDAVARKLRLSLRVTVLAGLPAMIVLCIGAGLALRLFGPGYVRTAKIPLMLLAVGYLPNIPKAHYIAVSRAQGRIPRAAAVLSTSAIAEVSAGAVGGIYGGLQGLTAALVAVYAVEGLVTARPVAKATITARHRRNHTASPVHWQLWSGRRRLCSAHWTPKHSKRASSTKGGHH